MIWFRNSYDEHEARWRLLVKLYPMYRRKDTRFTFIAYIYPPSCEHPDWYTLKCIDVRNYPEKQNRNRRKIYVHKAHWQKVVSILETTLL